MPAFMSIPVERLFSTLKSMIHDNRNFTDAHNHNMFFLSENCIQHVVRCTFEHFLLIFKWSFEYVLVQKKKYIFRLTYEILISESSINLLF